MGVEGGGDDGGFYGGSGGGGKEFGHIEGRNHVAVSHHGKEEYVELLLLLLSHFFSFFSLDI